jgi:hypothetical protein
VQKPIDLGTQNPNLRNSPIAWEYLDEEEWVGPTQEEQPGCFFNGVAYPNGTVVKADDAMLECRNGFWVPIATGDPENP